MNKWYRIQVSDKSELKVQQQLNALGFNTYVPVREVVIGNKSCNEMMNNGFIYAEFPEKYLERIASLPYVISLVESFPF